MHQCVALVSTGGDHLYLKRTGRCIRVALLPPMAGKVDEPLGKS
ncbi:MAG: hypothetical protein WBG32_19055 [Nodosilinea sp.]